MAIKRLLTLSCLLVGALTVSVGGARDLDQDEALELRKEGVILPLEALLQNALSRYPGARLLEAELELENGVYVYEVELLTKDGIARELELDGSTGEILKDEEDD
jgi:uncharacterized membrane protein YkoI